MSTISSGCSGMARSDDPVVVAAVEEPDVVDAGVPEDQRRPRRRDLAGPPPRPLLVGVSLGVAAVEDDGRVAIDAQALERGLELCRGPAVPGDRVLEPVRVEIKGRRDVVLGVLLGNAEVDVEQEPSTRRRDLRRPAGEEIAEPVDVDEPLEPGQIFDGPIVVGRPGRPIALESDDPVKAEAGEPQLERVGVGRFVAVDDDRVVRVHAPGRERRLEIDIRQAAEPLDRERGGPGDVPAARLAAEMPAVVGRERSQVDEMEVGLAEPGEELVGGHGGGGNGDRRGSGHGRYLAEQVG